MKMKKIIAALLAVTLFTAVPAGAAVMPETSSTAYESPTGLIEKCSISCRLSGTTLKFQLKTQASNRMEDVGFTSIVIQKSTDGQTWSNVRELGAYSEKNRRFCTLDRTYEVTETGWYRVACTHYADGLAPLRTVREKQSADNVSRSVYAEIAAPEPPNVTEATTAVTTVTTAVTTTRTTAVPDASLSGGNDGDTSKNKLTTSSKTIPVTTSTKSTAGSQSSPSTGDSGVTAALTILAASAALAFAARKRER